MKKALDLIKVVRLFTQTNTIISVTSKLCINSIIFSPNNEYGAVYSSRNFLFSSIPIPSGDPAKNLFSLSAVSDGWLISIPSYYFCTSFSIFSSIFLPYVHAVSPWNAEYHKIFNRFDGYNVCNRKIIMMFTVRSWIVNINSWLPPGCSDRID